MSITAVLRRSLNNRRIITTSATTRNYASSPFTKGESQGHPNDPKNKHKKDTESQSVAAGKKARSGSNESIDSASPNAKQKPQNIGSGNPEGVGFVEQVGGASSTAQHFESENGRKTGQEKR
ncbi:hypothetical protein BDQ12DRAFT_733742 [Crucibulum laeve]|uniref:Uncharacterized protein n=1 Tax=Crucibulum laeve TaxID=68775 RepID=A0A5C3M9K9_9AGAR|nr:hypothetical protein BDQ12DRAFT_733742 [Crucibulum laeve]